MRFPTSVPARIALICGGIGIGALVVVGSIKGLHRHEQAKEAQAAFTPPPGEELEMDLQKQASIQLKSDFETEEEANHPIQTVVAAGRGDTLFDLLVKAGVDRTEANKAIDALTDIYDPRALKAGQKVVVTFRRPADRIGSGPFDGLSLQPEPGLQVSAQRAGDGYSVNQTKREVTRQLAHFSGTIKGSLFEAAQGQGVPVSILGEMIKAFSYDVDFQRDIQPGDQFEVMFERFVDKKGQPVRDGEMLFARLTLSGDAMPIYRYADSQGNVDYYNPKGESVRKALLRTPVDGARISSSYGMRMHPILGFSTMHKGVDFSVSTGTPVMAAGSGVIDFAGARGSYGYYVRIKHDASHATAYAHLSRFAQGIREGKRVTQGQVIAFSGATGRATGPHLHYEVLVNNQQVNPMSVKFQSGNKLTGRELDRFLSGMKESNGWLAQTPLTSRVALNKN